MKDKFDLIFKKLNELRLDENILCKEFWFKVVRLNQNFDQAECWNLFINNIEWLINSNVITTTQIIEWFTYEELELHGVFVSGIHKVKDTKVIALGSAEIEASGHSKVTLFDSASCEAYDTSFVTCFHNSSAIGKGCILNGFHNSRLKIKGFGIAEGWDHCSIIGEGQSVVRLHEESTVTFTPNVTIIKSTVTTDTHR